MTKKLKSGYTTGTHATAAFSATLISLKDNIDKEYIYVKLPSGNSAKITVYKNNQSFISKKIDNDDIDATKGCEIFVKVLKKSPNVKHTPAKLRVGLGAIYIYAGDGVGVVTKKGLKIPVGFPAINPVPLYMMSEVANEILGKNFSDTLHVEIGVKDGKNIALETANAKVGVIGGISILGTTGIVKPISAGAYLDSIKAEISVADASHFKTVVFTLGNTAFNYAKKHYNEEIIIEIGNFLYDATKALKDTNFQTLVFITSIGKMTKAAQGFKNSHNRFGVIDFNLVKQWMMQELRIDLEDESFATVKGILQTITIEQIEPFILMMSEKSGYVFKRWIEELKLNIKHITTITTEETKAYKRELQW